MNSKKSADYCKLIENVKNKYRKNPIYTKNLTLGRRAMPEYVLRLIAYKVMNELREGRIG